MSSNHSAWKELLFGRTKFLYKNEDSALISKGEVLTDPAKFFVVKFSIPGSEMMLKRLKDR